MKDALGYRFKAGVLAPSTNTIVEPDYFSMAPKGCTFHIGRIYIKDADTSNNHTFENLLVQIRASIEKAVRDVMTCEPDAIITGMSAETFWGGKDGNEDFQRKIEELSGLRVYTGADACNKALQLYDVKRIGVVTPYQEIGDEQVVQFFEDCGYKVVRIKGLKCTTAVNIAHVTTKQLRDAIKEVDTPDVDAIIQCGTNLSMARLAAEAEHWLEKPVIAINTATLWYSLREQGILDQFDGFGSLFSKH